MKFIVEEVNDYSNQNDTQSQKNNVFPCVVIHMVKLENYPEDMIFQPLTPFLTITKDFPSISLFPQHFGVVFVFFVVMTNDLRVGLKTN